MPHKYRAAKPTLADAYVEWFDSDLSKRADWGRVSSTKDPVGTWEVDKFASFLPVGEPYYEIRLMASGAWIGAVSIALEYYQRRQESEQHRRRAHEAKELAASLDHFLAHRNKDRPALGFRSEKSFYEPQIPSGRLSGQQDDWLAIETHIRKLGPLLTRFQSDRKQLKLPPPNRTDILSMIFIGNMERAALQRLQPMSDADKHHFILAAWRDVGMPLPPRDQADVPEAWAEWMDKKLIAWKKMTPQMKRAIGFSQED